MLIVAGGLCAGLFNVEAGTSINSCLGMGLMIGFGVAVVVKDIILRAVQPSRKKKPAEAQGPSTTTGSSKKQSTKHAGIIALGVSVIALALCMLVGIGPASSVVVVLFSFVTVAMAAQSVGQTGIDPMEIFGLIVLLLVAAFGDTPQIQLFFVAAVIAVACGLGGDVMNDFKAGHIIGTSPKAQLIGQTIGGIMGAFISAFALYTLASTFGTDAFWPGKEFVSAQASVVANLIGGISCVPAFVVGVVAGFVLHCVKLPSMIIALGGESIVGVCIALMALFSL